jgi:aminoglycoside phosphotransferase (APT) family kinase protein
VLKLSPHRDDLDLDRRASTFARPGLPVPRVVDQGQAFDRWFTVAERVPGEPLEHVDAATWVSALPSVVDALNVLRHDFADHGTGWGDWDATGNGRHGGWREFLLATLVDQPGGRVSGWSQKPAARPELHATFEAARALIDRLARDDDVPRALLHCYLLYRNAHIHEGRLAGIFDWGCSVYGDPLMELGSFVFWNPWYPRLDVARLVDAMARCSPETDPRRHRNRWLVALAHIGATHIAYQAFIDRWDDADATAARTHHLATELGGTL